MLQQNFEVTENHNADVCATDQQRHRSLSLKPKFTWKRRRLRATWQLAL